jgi:mono/diheme cytochrome c family protein
MRMNERQQLLIVIVVFFSVIVALTMNELRNGAARRAWAQQDVTTGERIYRENCAACHGEKGDGKGPEVQRFKTKPRDFTAGIYKFRSTPSGSLPMDEDIFRTISRGVSGTGMLAQVHLSEKERWAVIEYLKKFSSRFSGKKPPEPISIPPKPSSSPQFVALGRSIYSEAGCAQCHGADGGRDGSSAKDQKDDWGNPILPPDLSLRPFKSGPAPEDLFRTISTGLNGTPMPSYAGALTPVERWALVSYIFSIATKEKPRGMMGLVGEEVEGMRIDMRAAMAGMRGGRGMMGQGGGMMNGNMRDMKKDMMGMGR